MEQAQFIGQIINDVILLATLGVIVWYTIKTADMAAATKLSAESAKKTLEEMREARDQESAPYVICYFEAAAHDQLIYFVVKNEGKLVAHNVHLSISPPLTTSHGPLEDMVLLSEGVASLVPGQEIRTLFDSTRGIFGRDDVPLRYKARISFSGGMSGRERNSDQVLDLAAYRGLFFTLESGMPELVKAVEGVKDHLGKVKGHLEDVSDRLDKGIWVQNAGSVTETSTTAAGVARSSLKAKLLEFQLVWESSPRDQKGEITPFRLDLQPRAVVLSHQILTLVAASIEGLPPDLTATITRIGADLLELGTMQFYIDGGRPLKRFTEAGDAIGATVRDVVARLQTKEVIEEPHNAIQPQTESADESSTAQTSADDIQAQSEEPGDRQEGDQE